MAHADKWLLRKASGSLRDHNRNGKYKDDRNTKNLHGEELPNKVGFKSAWTSMDTKLVKRWLYTQVGMDFNDVYSEFVSRIQPKYQAEYLECIYWYVEPAKEVEIDENGFARSLGQLYQEKGWRLLPQNRQCRFYVNPNTNLLCRISDEQYAAAKLEVKETEERYKSSLPR